MQQLHDATIDKLLETVFSMRSVPRCYKQDKSRVQSVGRQSQASKGVNTEAEEAMALEAITRWQPVKIQQTEKT
jgi:ribosomal protein S2